MHQENIKPHIYYTLVDNLVTHNVPFAIYQSPYSNTVKFVMQTSGKRFVYDHLEELSNKEGFVIAPFHIQKTSPIVLIAPDVLLEGKDVICKYLSEYIIPVEKTEKIDEQSFNVNADSFKSYQVAYQKFQRALHEQKYEKLILSRTLDYPRKSDFSAAQTFDKACEKYPDNFVFLYNTPQSGCWLGSTPELLLSGKGENWQTVSLAGTKDISPDIEWNDKNQLEQEIVTQYMKEQLTKAGCSFTYGEPFSVKAGNLLHLKTEFEFKMNNSATNVGYLLKLLHPSPAVCGFPKEEAFDFILHNEGYDRQYYSGFLGCLNINSRTDLFVNLRSMKIGDNSLRLYAGGGLLPSSDLESEWEETEKKLQTVLSMLIN